MTRFDNIDDENVAEIFNQTEQVQREYKYTYFIGVDDRNTTLNFFGGSNTKEGVCEEVDEVLSGARGFDAAVEIHDQIAKRWFNYFIVGGQHTEWNILRSPKTEAETIMLKYGLMPRIQTGGQHGVS